MFGNSFIAVFLLIHVIAGCNIDQARYERQQKLEQELSPKKVIQRFLEAFKGKYVPLSRVTNLVYEYYEAGYLSMPRSLSAIETLYADRHYFRDAYPLDLDQAQRYTEDFNTDFMGFLNITHLLV